jgi:CheY-like chemotaxis protein/nitrogen-specific signal transduction histidine kinase
MTIQAGLCECSTYARGGPPRPSSEFASAHTTLVRALEVLPLSAGARRSGQDIGQVLAFVSHELRLPLNVIVGTVDLLSETPLNDDQRAHLRSLQSATDSLLVLVNSILDLSKMEAGTFHLHEGVVDVRGVVQHVVDSVRVNASSKDLGVQVFIDETVPGRLIGDGDRLRQILANLVGNAIKFTNEGHVTVRAGCLEGSNGPVLRICVEDTGIGIEEKHLESVFEPFVQADSSTTRLYGGAGLGLAISRNLAELMGGELTVKSVHGKGSSFTLSVPTAEAPAAASAAAAATTARPSAPCGARETAPSSFDILLVEDDEDSRMLASTFLEEAARNILSVDSGAAAVDAFTSAGAGGFGLVLLDMQMPVMDGYDAARRMRGVERSGDFPHTPIVALTACALPEETAAALEAGCDACLTKPIKKAQLLEAVALYAKQ